MSILKPTPNGLFVQISHLLVFKSKPERDVIINFWHTQGYAKSVPIPYARRADGLYVEHSFPEAGFYEGTGTLDQELYEIPF